MPTVNLGRVGFVNKGNYIGGVTAYKLNDTVKYNGIVYACIQAHSVEHLPTDTLYWQPWTNLNAHVVTNVGSTVRATADSAYINSFTGSNTGIISVKITGLVAATAATVDINYLEIVVTQDDRDHALATNPHSYKFMIKGDMDAGIWYNTQAVCIGTTDTLPINVRFTRTATDAYIEIGDIGTAWVYPTVEVSHLTDYIIPSYTKVFIATLQNSLVGTTTDRIISVSNKLEDTLQSNVASASTCTIGTYGLGDTVHITGTTTITSLGVSTTGTTRKVIFDSALTLTYNVTSLKLPTSANILVAAGDSAEFVCEYGTNGYWTCLDYQRKDGTSLSAQTNISGVRQTVQSSLVDGSGFANFVSIGTGLAVNIAATTTPLKIHAAGGAISNDRLGTISADTSISGLTANTTNYLYADVAANGTVTLSANTVAHLEQFGGTLATTSNLLTFYIGHMTGYTGNGATAPQTWRVPFGEAVTNATNVTSVVTYALNGMYDSGLTTNLPGTSTSVSKNHNIGTTPREARIVLKNRVTQAGYPVGVELIGATTRDTNGVDLAIEPALTSLTMVISTSNNNAFNLVPYAGGAATAATQTSWDYKFICKRGW